MNILQIQSALTKLDDNQLKQEMLSPGMAPQFLVLSEMQRRQEVRRGGQKGPPPPQTTLKDEAMAETGAPPTPPPQGLAALPEGAETARGVQGFAAGGAVGGNIIVRNGITYDLDQLTPDQRMMLLAGASAVPEPAVPASPQTWGLTGRAMSGKYPPQGVDPVVPRAPGMSLMPYGSDQDPAAALNAYRPAPPRRWGPGAGPAVETPDRRGPAGNVTPPGDIGAQGLGGDELWRTPQALAPDAARLSPDVPAAAPEAPPAGLPSLRNRPAPSDVDAALAAMPKYPATRTAAMIESGLGANTNHGGSFKGILGVGDAMWKDYRDRLHLKESDRENPEAQRRIYESFTEDQRKANPKLSDSDIYTAWAMGPAAARAARAAPDSDAYATYARLTSKEQADKAFSTNPGLLQSGRTNADTLAAYRARYALAERGDTIPAGRGPDGTEIRVAPPGSGAAAVNGDSTTPLAFSVKGSDPTVGGDKGPRTFEDYMNSARGPDRFAGSEDEARRLFGGNAAEERKNAVNFGLMEAGLRIMGSNSPRLAGAISEGGIAGLQTYRQGLEAARRDEKEGFGARMGIAAARARQDDTAAHTGATLYGADSQAASARGNNATTLRAAEISANAGIRGHEISAGASREVAGINAAVHREGYGRSDPLRVAEWVMAAPTPEEYQRRLQASGRDRLGFGGGTHDHQLVASFNTEDSRLRDDFRLKKEDQFLPPEQKAAKQRDLDRQYQAARQELLRRYARLSPTAFGADAPAAPAAPAAAAAPVGAYDPATRSIVR